MLSTQQKERLGPLFDIANAVRLQFLRFRLSGKGVQCPCCNHEYKHFAPFGNPKRANAWCPNCESLERHRLLWIYLENETDMFRRPIRLLHVAPETVFFKKFASMPKIEYHPVDLFPNMYPKGTKSFDITNNTTPDNSFDVIICNHVFQYIQDDRLAMSEIFRLLKPDGFAILQVPIKKSLEKTYEDDSITDPLEREKAFGLKEHVRFYGPDYQNRLASCGFKVDVVDYTSRFSNESIFKLGLLAGDDIYHAIK
jgi:SAM-dependent methyltransferase